jgi:hypothetical protein
MTAWVFSYESTAFNPVNNLPFKNTPFLKPFDRMLTDHISAFGHKSLYRFE